MAKDHGPSVKNDEQYEGLRKKGMSKSRAAAISNSPGSSSRSGKSSGSSQSRQSRGSGSGGKQAHHNQQIRLLHKDIRTRFNSIIVQRWRDTFSGIQSPETIG